MRTDQEMLSLIIETAKQDEHVRLVTLEGSRTNPNIAADQFQDFDVSYFVTDAQAFIQDEGWLDVFGEQVMMQKPEDMELFPPSLGGWFSYLMLFQDGNRIDLKVIPVEDKAKYFEQGDGLVEVLLDKDEVVSHLGPATDQKYWTPKPSAREFDDCCNEFWWVSSYVAKGLARHEFLYAVDHLHGNVRPNLLRMMSWQIGIKHGFNFSVGKNYKFIDRYLPKDDWQKLLSTYAQQSEAEVWEAMAVCQELFRKYAQQVANELGYVCPTYDVEMTKYIEGIRSQNEIK